MNEATEGVQPEDLVRELEAMHNRRLELLERDNERLRRNGVMMLVAMLGMLALSVALLVTTSLRGRGGGVAEAVEARSFVLRDEDGHVRGVLGFSRDGGPRLMLQDRDGRERLRLTLLPDGSPGLSFTDREGRSRAALGFLSDETTMLVFADRWGRTRAVLGLSPDESSSLVFADRNGETRVGLGIEQDGSANLTLFEKEAAPAAAPAPGAEEDTAASGLADVAAPAARN